MDENKVGTASPPFDMVIESGKVREFRRATAFKDSIDDRDAVHIPPTFLVTQEFWHDASADPFAMVDFDVERGLHAEQEFRFFGPPPTVGTRLRCVTRIDAAYTKPRHGGGDLTFMVAVTEYRDDSGEIVAESRLTGVEVETDTDKEPEENHDS